jgi:hypothetical protein
MKTLLVIAIVIQSLAVSAQVDKKPSDSLYIVTYTTGSLWDAAKSPNDQPYFKEHSARLGQLRKEGVIRFGARYSDKGAIVISASTFQHAKEIVFADVAVINKLFSADVQKLNIFYEGCLERPK